MRPVFSLVMMFAELSMGSAATPQAPPVRSTPQAPEVREVVPYASLFAHCSRGGSGTLYVGVPAPKDAKGVYTVLPADNREGVAVGVYDCGPGAVQTKRAVEVAPVPFGQGEKSPTTRTTFAQSATVRSSSWTASPAAGASTFIGVQRVTVGGTSRIAGFYYGSSCANGNCPR